MSGFVVTHLCKRFESEHVYCIRNIRSFHWYLFLRYSRHSDSLQTNFKLIISGDFILKLLRFYSVFVFKGQCHVHMQTN